MDEGTSTSRLLVGLAVALAALLIWYVVHRTVTHTGRGQRGLTTRVYWVEKTGTITVVVLIAVNELIVLSKQIMGEPSGRDLIENVVALGVFIAGSVAMVCIAYALETSRGS